MFNLFNELKFSCQFQRFYEDLNEFCEDNCSSQIIMRRLTANFNNLSSIYNEIMEQLYDTNADSLIQEFGFAQDLGIKSGEFTRVLLGFSIWKAINLKYFS